MSDQNQVSLTRKVAHNTIIQFGGKAIGTILAVVIAGLMMRYLGPEGFGEYTIIVTFLAIFCTMADLGLYPTLAREISKEGADIKKIVSNTFTIRFIFGFGILLLAPLVVLFFPYSNLVKRGILIGVISYLCILLIQVLWGVFQKYFHMEKIALGEVVAKIVWLLGIVLVIRMNWSLLAIVAIIALANFINFGMVFLFAQKFVKFRLAFNFLEWKRLLSIAWPLAITAILTLIYFRVNVILLSVLKSETEVGIYGAANKIIEFLVTFSAIFGGLLLPVLSRTVDADRQKFIKVYQKGFDVLAIVALPLVFGAQFFAGDIMTLLGGKEFLVSSHVLRILIFACAFIFFAHIFTYAVIACNQQKKAMWFYGLAAVVALVGNLLFIPRYSYYATASISIISEAIICLSCAWIVARAIRVRPRLGIILKSLVAGGVMSGILAVLPPWHFSISLAIGIVSYFIVLYLIKGFSIATAKEIIRFR